MLEDCCPTTLPKRVVCTMLLDGVLVNFLCPATGAALFGCASFMNSSSLFKSLSSRLKEMSSKESSFAGGGEGRFFGSVLVSGWIVCLLGEACAASIASISARASESMSSTPSKYPSELIVGRV